MALPARRWLLTLGFVLCVSGALGAQSQRPPSIQVTPRGALLAAVNAEPSGESFTFTFFNRPIVTFRAKILGRRPVERAMSARRILDDLISEGITGPVESRALDNSTIIDVGTRGVLVLTAPDIDELAGETLDGVTAETVLRLRQALEEAAEARAPGMLLRNGAVALGVLLFAVATLWVLARAHRRIVARLVAVAEQTATKSGLFDLTTLRASSHLADFGRHLVTALITILDLVVILSAATMILRRFPYTRPWGESISGFLVTTAQNLALGVVNALPGLFTVFIILAIVRFLVRLIRLWFNAVERGQVEARFIHPETAQPTRRLISALLWIFGIVVAYPYMPGSQTDAFKGVSVFLGLMVTFGSSGLVNQIMSSFMITYSRALRPGDFVRIGDVEGTVLQLGVLSTKIKTLRLEEVTIPNAVVVSTNITDYSRYGDTEGVFTPTSVTIGYDTPWRQVHALLLLAAERTPGLRSDPKPIVLQAGLEDFYVKYTLLVCLERQQSRPIVLGALHANIQDLFNEYGVQIMSPNYVLDPAGPKVVPKEHWFDAPAQAKIEHPQGV